MSEPFFDYIKSNRHTVSRQLYGVQTAEKKYSNLEYVRLPEAEECIGIFAEVLRKRKSSKHFKDIPMELSDLSYVLKYSIGKDELSLSPTKYHSPSGGSMHAMETYLIVNNVNGLETGTYHYSSVEHALAKLPSSAEAIEELSKMLLGYMKTDTKPGVYVFMTMVKSRTIHKYGSLSYMLALLEAGHRGQNICLVATSRNVGCCPTAAPLYDEVNAVLGVDGVNEHHVYTLALGQGRDI